MSGMAIEKYIGKPRGFTRPSYRDLHTGKVTVDDKGRMFPFGTEEVNAVVLEARFHFFEAEAGEDWPKVRARHGLRKTKTRSCFTFGVRQGEGYKVGLYPKRSSTRFRTSVARRRAKRRGVCLPTALMM
jgi:hypothetical protein